MSYKIQSADAERESFGNLRYHIYKGDLLIAHYWHDHRGDDHGIEFVNGPRESWPVGRMTEFIEEGGPKPLTLSARAVAYLERKRVTIR